MPLVPSSSTLVITSFPATWDGLAEYTVKRMKQYCDANGYDLHADRSTLFDRWYNPATGGFEQLPIKGFVKLDLFLHFLPHYKRIAWLDADLVITNTGKRLPTLHANVDLILPYDYNGHNATVIIARSCERIRQFFWACNNTGRKFFLKHDWAEMEAMRYFLQTPPYTDGFCAYRSIKELCALKIDEYEPYVPASVSGEYAWEPGDFSVHLSALTLERRIELARFYTENH